MKPVQQNLLITTVCSFGLGVLAIIPVVNSDNGYVAGFVFLPLLLLIGIAAFILFFAGLVTITKKAGPYLLLSSLLLPVGFFTGAFTAKYFEIGAYREDPMISLLPETSNIVLFKHGVSNEQISTFWNDTLATQREDGRGYEHLPGIGGIGRLPAFEGHEVVEFHFFDSATDEQREFVYDRVRSSPIVHELKINVSTKPFRIDQSESSPERLDDGNSLPKKIVIQDQRKNSTR